MKEIQGPAKTSSSLPTPNLRRGPRVFLRDVQREVKQINWPTFKETTRLTGIVLGICFLSVVVLYILSLLIGFGFHALGVRN